MISKAFTYTNLFVDCPKSIDEREFVLDVFQYVDLTISTITFATALLVGCISLFWWFHLKGTKTGFRPWIFGTFLLCVGILTWSAPQIYQITHNDINLPFYSIVGRLAIMFGIMFKFFTSTKMRVTPQIESLTPPIPK